MKKAFERMASGLSWLDSHKINAKLALSINIKKKLTKIMAEWRKITMNNIKNMQNKSKSAQILIDLYKLHNGACIIKKFSQ